MSAPAARPTAARRHRPRKRYGQHFLERAWVDKVVEAVAPAREDRFFEIGPGRGALTAPLAGRARHVIAIDIDRDLAAGLERAGYANVTVLTGDVLAFGADDIRRAAPDVSSGIRVVGNLPYNVSSPILFHLLDLRESGLPIVDAVLMVQREVANRVAARPGSREYGVLSVQLGHVADVDWLLTLPPGAFRPPPAVHSALIRLRFHEPIPPVRDVRAMRTLVRAVFTQRRKTLVNSLAAAIGRPRGAAAAILARAGLDGRRRPETVTIAELAGLSNALEETRHDNAATPVRGLC